jgi:hypothetical protein
MVLKRLSYLAAMLTLAAAAGSRGEEKRMPAMHRTAILFKMLTYDQNLRVRCSSGVRIGVVGVKENQESMTMAQETLKAISAGKGKKIEGLLVHGEMVTASKPADIWRAVDSHRLNILYLSSGLDEMMDKIAEFAKLKKVLVVTGEAGYLKSGAALGIVLREGKPKILMHHKTATGQGAKFDLRITRIVERVD